MKDISRRTFCKISASGALALGAAATLPSTTWMEKAIHRATWRPRPQFLHWSFGGVAYASAVSAQSSDFKLWFTPAAERREYDFRAEVVRAAEELDIKRAGAPVALCFSGGVDSEVLAVTLKKLGIPFELYFADFFGHNRAVFDRWVAPVAARLGKKVNVVSISSEDFLAKAREDFAALGCEAPTYLGLMQLFRAIPANRYIVTGDGDLDRQGDLFAHLGLRFPILGAGTSIAYSSSAVAYDLWAQTHGRKGEFYFFRSTPELVAAALTNPRFESRYPYSDTKKLVHHAFPEVARRPKTTNWDTIAGALENRRIRRELERFASTEESLSFWRRLNGTATRADAIFV